MRPHVGRPAARRRDSVGEGPRVGVRRAAREQEESVRADDRRPGPHEERHGAAPAAADAPSASGVMPSARGRFGSAPAASKAPTTALGAPDRVATCNGPQPQKSASGSAPKSNSTWTHSAHLPAARVSGVRP